MNLMRIWLIGLFVMAALPLAQAQSPTGARDPDALPDGVPATGTRNIAEVWLIEPTTRYDHHVEGTPYEAAGLRARLANGTLVTLRLDEEFVFEDRRPRLADLDDDGKDEIIVVLSSVREGASLAAYAIVGDQVVLKARTPFIGASHRWLNPAGVADYDGDGQLDVTFVAMPHLVKRLEMWTLDDGGFRQTLSAENFSNHRNGSSHTGMSASADFNGDGVTDLALPDGDRRIIRVVSFAGREPHEINRLSLSAPADGDFQLGRDDQGFLLRVPLSNGNIQELHP